MTNHRAVSWYNIAQIQGAEGSDVSTLSQLTQPTPTPTP